MPLAWESPQRFVPPQRQVGAFDSPANKLRLIHVRPEGNHDPLMGRVPHETL
jgi:hypothetical protein